MPMNEVRPILLFFLAFFGRNQNRLILVDDHLFGNHAFFDVLLGGKIEHHIDQIFFQDGAEPTSPGITLDRFSAIHSRE